MLIPTFVPILVVLVGLGATLALGARGARRFEVLYGVLIVEWGGALFGYTQSVPAPARVGVSVFFALAATSTAVCVLWLSRRANSGATS